MAIYFCIIDMLEKMMEESSQHSLTNKKHQWTKKEDKKLMECLLELATCRKRTGDNGTFKVGYIKQLERRLHQKMLGCVLKANLYIESRVKLLKKQYYAIIEMLKTSGFGWNDEEKMVVMEKTIFQVWVKAML